MSPGAERGEAGAGELPSRSLSIEAASAADLEAIRAMLEASGLPIDDIEAHIPSFLLAKRDRMIGTVALEYAGSAALLRSLCVLPEYRGEAVGTRLLTAIEAEASSRGVRALYLLTTSAAAFFERHGFSPTARSLAPSSLRGSAQFRSLCPATAVCMRKPLPSRLPRE